VNSRKVDRNGGNTTAKEKLLDAAEALFCAQEYKSVTIRQITKRAKVDLASVNYHFGSKDKLFEAVMQRRIDHLNEERLRLLDAARVAAAGKSPPVEAIVRAYVVPLLERFENGGPGWKNYCRLISRIATMPGFSVMAAKALRPSVANLFRAFCRSLPGADEKDVHFAFSFLMGSMTMTLAQPSWVEIHSNGAIRASDVGEAVNKLIPFITAGFVELASRNEDRLQPGKHRRIVSSSSDPTVASSSTRAPRSIPVAGEGNRSRTG
jgi:AcrR family transcriptional regulator